MQEPAEHGPASFGLPYLHPRRMSTFTTCQSQAFMASDVILLDTDNFLIHNGNQLAIYEYIAEAQRALPAV